MHQLKELLLNNIAAGLKRKSVTEPSRWAIQYRVMGQPFPGPWNFKYHPWLKEMHDSKAELNVGQKSAQMGYSEAVLNITFFEMDVNGRSCLYVLPAKTPDATDFSASRFDPALDLSNHLSNLFSDVKNVGHKRAGAANLFIRGSKARGGLKSIPVGFIVLDEVDEMTQNNIPLAFERVSGQRHHKIWMLSTPTIPGFGINKYYTDTTQERFFFKCPSCSRFIELTFPESLEIIGTHPTDPELSRTFLKCQLCKTKLNHEEKHIFLANNEWVKEYPNRAARGFHINQMYSSTVLPSFIAKKYFLGLKDQASEQEFYNSALGRTHIVDGARLTEANIEATIGNYRTKRIYQGNKIVTMGIDVGRELHYEVDEWTLPAVLNDDVNVLAKPRVIAYGKVKDFLNLYQIMMDQAVVYAVIDAQPERRKSIEFAQAFYKRVKTCFYGRGLTGKNVSISPEEEHQITVDRTSWLDLALGRFKAGTITTPLDIDLEYKAQLQALIRVPKKDDDGNITFRYEHADNEPDHYAHARCYAEIALIFAVGIGDNTNIKAPI